MATASLKDARHIEGRKPLFGESINPNQTNPAQEGTATV